MSCPPSKCWYWNRHRPPKARCTTLIGAYFRKSSKLSDCSLRWDWTRVESEQKLHHGWKAIHKHQKPNSQTSKVLEAQKIHSEHVVVQHTFVLFIYLFIYWYINIYIYTYDVCLCVCVWIKYISSSEGKGTEIAPPFATRSCFCCFGLKRWMWPRIKFKQSVAILPWQRRNCWLVPAWISECSESNRCLSYIKWHARCKAYTWTNLWIHTI